MHMVSTYVRMYVCMYVCTFVHICTCTYLCMYEAMYVQRHQIAFTMYACVHVHIYYLKPSYFSGTLILVILVSGLVIAKFNMH